MEPLDKKQNKEEFNLKPDTKQLDWDGNNLIKKDNKIQNQSNDVQL